MSFTWKPADSPARVPISPLAPESRIEWNLPTVRVASARLPSFEPGTMTTLSYFWTPSDFLSKKYRLYRRFGFCAANDDGIVNDACIGGDTGSPVFTCVQPEAGAGAETR